MPITLLLDLDDTLLDTNLEAFLPAYYQSLSACLADVAPPAQFLAALKASVFDMMQNHDPSRTLQEVFEGGFYPTLRADPGVLRGRILDFYRGEFRNLETTTRRRPGVNELIDWARSTGHLVALATDPLFPMVATLERVRWAGLDPRRFELISTFETFHFSKSHPAYFAELLGRLGWPDQPALMAGNDIQRDLEPARRLGIATFQVLSPGAKSGEAAGDLIALRGWIERHGEEIPSPALTSRDAILAVLESTPAALDGLTRELTSSAWVYEPGPDEWSTLELVCHLRDTEREVHAQQISTLLASPEPFVARPDAAYWAKQRRYLNENGPEAVRAFTSARKENLERLQAAPGEAWQKSAKHAIFGPSNFQEVIGFMAEHDRLHLQQAWRTLQGAAQPAHRN